MSNKKVCIK